MRATSAFIYLADRSHPYVRIPEEVNQAVKSLIRFTICDMEYGKKRKGGSRDEGCKGLVVYIPMMVGDKVIVNCL